MSMCSAAAVRMMRMVVCGAAKSRALASRLWMAWRRRMGSPCRTGWAVALNCSARCLGGGLVLLDGLLAQGGERHGLDGGKLVAVFQSGEF